MKSEIERLLDRVAVLEDIAMRLADGVRMQTQRAREDCGAEVSAILPAPSPDPSPDDAALEEWLKIELKKHPSCFVQGPDVIYAVGSLTIGRIKDAFLAGAAHGRKGERNKTLDDVVTTFSGSTAGWPAPYHRRTLADLMALRVEPDDANDEGAAKQ